jgi:hypothetical protein
MPYLIWLYQEIKNENTDFLSSSVYIPTDEFYMVCYTLSLVVQQLLDTEGLFITYFKNSYANILPFLSGTI